MRYIILTFVVITMTTACGPDLQEPSKPPEARSASASDRVMRMEELTQTDIDQVDRNESIVFLTFGNVEAHGPQNPTGSDYFQAVGVRNGLIERLKESHPNFVFLLYPVVPMAVGGANDMARQFDYVGTFDVRFETLRDVAIDLGASIARQGFRYIFVDYGHAAPLNSVALTDAAAFVSEKYGARMVNVTSMVFGPDVYSKEVITKYLGEGWQDQIGFESHAGAAETSANLYLRGDLVDPEYKSYEPFIAKKRSDFLTTYQHSEGWRGYWGDPAKASVDMGKDLMDSRIDRAHRIAEMVLAGEDLSSLPVYPEDTLPKLAEGAEHHQMMMERYSQQTAEIEAWRRTQDQEK